MLPIKPLPDKKPKFNKYDNTENEDIEITMEKPPITDINSTKTIFDSNIFSGINSEPSIFDKNAIFKIKK